MNLRHEVADLTAALAGTERVLAEAHHEVMTLRADLARVTAERDSYRKAKQENDERFMVERDEARTERDRLLKSLRAVMANSEINTDAFILARAALEGQ
jgi:hypothetical protein